MNGVFKLCLYELGAINSGTTTLEFRVTKKRNSQLSTSSVPTEFHERSSDCHENNLNVLQNKCLIATFGLDTAENERPTFGRL